MKKKYILIISVIVMIFSGLFLSGCKSCKPDQPVKEPTYYYVTFDENNGKTSMVRVEEGKTVAKPSDPIKEGYDFLYWSYNDQEFNFSTPIENNITLVAKYEEEAAKKTTRIVWNEDEAVEYLFDGSIPRVVEVGSVVKFKLKVSPYYEGEVKVLVNEKVINKDSNEYYSFIAEDLVSTSVDIDGLTKQDEKIKGLGTIDSPYQIYNESQFKVFADRVNSLNDTKYNSSYFVLENDLDFNNFTLDVIGTELNYNHFSGSFDGQNHKISNFVIESNVGMYGLFGYVVTGEISNLVIENDLVIDPNNDSYNIIGGLVAYNIASDIVNCKFNGSITVNNNLAMSAQVYVGGLVGYMQSYSDTGLATLSYGSCSGEINLAGDMETNSCGGLVGVIYGAEEAYPAFIYNSVFEGSISGKVLASGGIVGTLRMYSSIANCYTKGTISASSVARNTAAGALCGIAENETAVAYSFSNATLASSNPNNQAYIIGTLVGASYDLGNNDIDTQKVLILNSYYSQNSLVEENNQQYNLENYQDIMALLKWQPNDWHNDLTPNFEEGEKASFVVNFSFGKNVTNEALDGSLLTQSIDQVTINDLYLPLYWVYNGSGMNTFVADDGSISYGFFLDEARTIRVPSSFLLCQNTTIYVGFADYSEVVGEYYVLLKDQQIKLTFEANGRMVMLYDGKVSNYMYVYDGSKVLIKDGYFAFIEYPELAENNDLYVDYYATVKNNNLIIYNNEFFPVNEYEIIANKYNLAMGIWYDPDDRIYTFLSDGTGNIDGVSTFSYECSGNEVKLSIGNEVIVATINGSIMEATDGFILSITKFDDYRGVWESEFSNPDTIEFDDKGKVVYQNKTYQYTLNDDNTLTFDEYTAYFNENDLLVLRNNENEKIFGQKGSFIGTWMDTFLNYWLVLEGINKYGYGYGYDSNGFDLTYSLVGNDNINLYYRNSLYGYGFFVIGNIDDIEMEIFELAIYTPSRGMIVDDYSACYIDSLYGTWHGEDGMTVTFNGLGAYDISKMLTEYQSMWEAQGFVTIEEAGNTVRSRYSFDRQSGTGRFEYKDVTYQVTKTTDGLIINNKSFKAPDELSQYQYQFDDVIISFNGKSKVGLGKVSFKDRLKTIEYRYEINDNKVNIYSDTTLVYVLTISPNKYELLEVATSKTHDLGLYHVLINYHYVLSSQSELIFDHYFDITGVTTATLMTESGSELVDVRYIDENYVALYYNGTFLYYVYYLDESCATICDYNLNPLSVIAISDELRGKWLADDGNMIVFSGISKASAYGRASCDMSQTDEVESYVAVYYYEAQNDYFVIYDLVNNVEIEKYYVYTTYHDDAIAYHLGDKTIYVVAIKD